MNNDQVFEFNLSGNNQVKPKSLDRMDIRNLLNRGKIDEVNKIINDLSHENFEENGKFV